MEKQKVPQPVCMGSIELGTACGWCSKCREWLARHYPGRTFEQAIAERRQIWAGERTATDKDGYVVDIEPIK